MKRRRRNPAIGKTIESAVGVTAGVLATELLPSMLFGPASGVNSVLIQGAVGIGVSLGARAVNRNFGDNVLVGSVASLLVSFLKNNFGIGGTGLSFYVDNGFPLPTAGSGPYLLNQGYSGSVPQMNGGIS